MHLACHLIGFLTCNVKSDWLGAGVCVGRAYTAGGEGKRPRSRHRSTPSVSGHCSHTLAPRHTVCGQYSLICGH